MLKHMLRWTLGVALVTLTMQGAASAAALTGRVTSYTPTSISVFDREIVTLTAETPVRLEGASAIRTLSWPLPELEPLPPPQPASEAARPAIPSAATAATGRPDKYIRIIVLP